MFDLKINWSLLPLKGQYFLWNAGTAPIVPFLPIYARQLGFSSLIVGTIYTVLPITGMIAKPLFGAIADRFQLQKFLFLAFQIVTAVTFFCIHFIPEIPTESPATLECSDLTYFKTCNNFTDKCAAARVVAETGNNDTVYCQFHCQGNEDLIREVSQTWHIPGYNDPSPNETFINFQVEVSMGHTLQMGPCLNFRVQHAITEDGIHVPYCQNFTLASCQVECNSPSINEVLQRSTVGDSHISEFYQFWIFFLLMILSWVAMAVVVSIGDTICFEMLGDKPSLYGQQRLWGAVGWGIFAIISGIMVDEFSKGRLEKDYTSVFYLMLALLILDFIVSSRLKHSQTKLSASIVRDVGKLLAEPKLIIFMLWCIAVGISTGLQWNFLFWHLEDMASADDCNVQYIKTIEGLVMGVQCFCGELPFFFLSGRILKKIGHVHAMSLVLFAFGCRFLIYSFLKDPWWCLPVELLQGFTFGLFYATMASYASIVAPPGTEATVQGTVGAVFEGVGVSLGSLLGGMLFDRFGGAVTFQSYGIASLILFIIHFLVQFWLDRKSEYSPQAKVKSQDPQDEITDFSRTARYAAPNEAIHMLDEELSPS